MKLKIDIAIGNAAMASGEDVADALRELADKIGGYGDPLEAAWPAGASGSIIDGNGNGVGGWRLTPAGED